MDDIPKHLLSLLVYILEDRKPVQVEILDLSFVEDSPELNPFTPYLFVENVLGIPKKPLIKAFIAAKNGFFEILDVIRPKNGSSLDGLDPVSGQRLETLSKVMLLYDSEHQTVINTRKRLIRQGLIDPQQELAFLKLIFTSPLHRHTKSPLLWIHRRFLIEFMISPPPVMEELEVILSAARHHPKNYLAWNYARFIFTYTWQTQPFGDNLREIHQRLWKWCKLDVSDISGWTFLLWYLRPERAWYTALREVVDLNEVIEHAIRLEESVLSGHEALWTFIGAVLVDIEGIIPKHRRVKLLLEVMDYLTKSKVDEEDDKLKDKLYGERLVTRARRRGLLPAENSKNEITLDEVSQ